MRLFKFVMIGHNIYIFYFFLFWWITYILSKNLDEVFTYNHKALISLQSRSHVKSSMIVMIDPIIY